MDCKEFKNNIPVFFEDNLDIEKAEEFIKHAASCKECAEEMEIMHLLLVGLKKLDEEEGPESYDFGRILKDRLALLEKRCVNLRNFGNLHRAVIITLNLATVIGMAYWMFMWLGGITWVRNFF